MEAKAAEKLGITSVKDFVDTLEDNEYNKFIAKFEIKKLLGCGGFGVVLAVTDLESGEDIALKIV